MPQLPEEEGNGRERWLLGVAIATGVSIGLSGHLDFRTLIWEARSSSAIGEATDWPVHASRKWKPPIQRQLGGGGSGMPAGSGSRPSSASLGAVEVECQHEVEAAHPAPARGRWKPANPGLVAVMSLMLLRLRACVRAHVVVGYSGFMGLRPAEV